MDIVMTGYAGLRESKRLAEIHRELLLKTLRADFLDDMQELSEGEGLPESSREYPVLFCEEIGQGGVFEALWNLAEQAETGLNVELARIPIRQETIEVCEIVDCNPYQLPSGGWLYLTENGNGAPGTVIGRTHKQKARTITGYEGVRYLDKPRHNG